MVNIILINLNFIEKPLSSDQAKHDYKLDELATKRDIELLRSENRAQIAESKADLIRWVVSVGVLQTALLTGVLLRLAHLI